MKNLVRRNIILYQTIVSLIQTIFIGIYVNVLTSYIFPNKNITILKVISDLNLWNILIALAFLLLFFQLYITSLPAKDIKSTKKEVTEQILAAACRSLIYPHKNLHIRAVVTICDYKRKIRRTTYSYNFRTDPERTAIFPLYFGATGEALQRRSTIFKELPENHVDTYEPDIQTMISADLKCILAAPIFNPTDPQGNIIGILAFDSFETLKTIKLNNRESLDIAQSWADTISHLLVL